jgi:hypothetical protein
MSADLGAGVGSAHTQSANSLSEIANVTVIDSRVTAHAGRGSGIGTSFTVSEGRAIVHHLLIVNGTIDASSSERGAGIGTSSSSALGNNEVETVTVVGGQITARGDYGAIGSGANGRLGQLRFIGSPFVRCQVNEGEEVSVAASEILFSNASPVFLVEHTHLFASTQSGSIHGSPNLVILYDRVTAEGHDVLSWLSQPFLHIGNVSLPAFGSWRFCLSRTGYGRCFETGESEVKSLIVSAPSGEDYSLQAARFGATGWLETRDGDPTFGIGFGSHFVDEAHFISVATPTVPFTESVEGFYASRWRMKMIVRFMLFTFIIHY